MADVTGPRITMFAPHLDGGERAAVERVLSSGRLSRGDEVCSFEQEFAGYVGRAHAIAVSSGTAALHLLVVAMGWSDGARILTSALGYVASANALRYERARPEFVDIDERTFNMRVDERAVRAAPDAKGLLLVHLLGLPVDPDGCRALIRRHGLEVIEDASQALGRPSAAFPIGTYGRAATYSFHESKALTTGGEGGMIVTDDQDLAVACRSLRDQGCQHGADWLKSVTLGYNYRLTELQAAIGRAQLRKLPAMLERRSRIAALYTHLLAEVPCAQTPCEPPGLERSWFMYFIRLASPRVRDRVEAALATAGVETRRMLPPIPRFPAHRDGRRYPCAEQAAATLLALPLHLGVSDDDAAAIVEVLRSACGTERPLRRARV